MLHRHPSLDALDGLFEDRLAADERRGDDDHATMRERLSQVEPHGRDRDENDMSDVYRVNAMRLMLVFET